MKVHLFFLLFLTFNIICSANQLITEETLNKLKKDEIAQLTEDYITPITNIAMKSDKELTLYNAVSILSTIGSLEAMKSYALILRKKVISDGMKPATRLINKANSFSFNVESDVCKVLAEIIESDCYWRDKILAAQILSTSGNQKYVQYLFDVFEDYSPLHNTKDVQQAVLEALCNVENKKVINFLINKTKGKSLLVVSLAQRMLESKNKNVIFFVRNLINPSSDDFDLSLAKICLKSIELYGNSRDIDLLKSISNSKLFSEGLVKDDKNRFNNNIDNMINKLEAEKK